MQDSKPYRINLARRLTLEAELKTRSEQTLETRKALKSIKSDLREIDNLFTTGMISRKVYDFHKDKILDAYMEG